MHKKYAFVNNTLVNLEGIRAIHLNETSDGAVWYQIIYDDGQKVGIDGVAADRLFAWFVTEKSHNFNHSDPS